MSRRRLLILLVPALVVLAILAGVTAASRSADARRWVAEGLANLAGGAGTSIRIGHVDGLLPFDATLHDVEVADTDGVWLTLRRADLDWSPARLFSGRLQIDRLAASGATVLRPPNLPPEEEPPDSEADPPFRLPDLPVDVDIRAFVIDRLMLAPPVLGQAVALSAEASAELPKGGGDAALRAAVRRLDQPAALDLNLSYAAAAQRLRIGLALEEPQGGALATLAGLDGAPPVSLHLAGDGPLSGWRGRLRGSAGDQAGIDAEIGLAGMQPLVVSVQGTANVAGLVPEAGAGLGAGEVIVALRGSFDPATGRIEVRQGDVATAVAGLSLTGSLRADGRQLALDLHARVPQIAAAARPFGVDAAGVARLNAEIRGRMRQPRVSARANVADGRFGDVGVESLTLEAVAEALSPLDRPAGRLDYGLTAEASAPKRNGAPLPGIGERLRIEAGGRLEPASGDIALARLQASTDGITVSGHAEIRGWRERLTGQLELAVADLKKLPGAGQLAGSAVLQAVIEAEPARGLAEARLTGRVGRLATAVPALDAIIGPEPALSGRLRYADGIEINGLKVQSRHADAQASGRITADFQHVDGKVSARLAGLQPLGEAMGVPLGGTAVAEATIRGPLGSPVASGTVAARGLRIGETDLQQVELTWRVEDPAGGPHGRLALALPAPGIEARIESSFALSEEAFRLHQIRLGGPYATGQGSLDVLLRSGLLHGDLEARIGNLGPWVAHLGREAGGRLQASARLRPGDDGQGLTLRLAAGDLSLAGSAGEGRPLRIARATASAELTNALVRPSGTIAVDIGQVASGEARIEQAKLDGRFRDGRLQFTSSMAGRLARPFRIAAEGEAAVTDMPRTLSLAKLSGRIAGQRLSLNRPLVVAVAPDRFSLEGLDLGIGSGRIAGSAVLGDRLEGRLDVKDLPLRLLEVMQAGLAAEGTLSAELAVSGTPAAPIASVRASLAGVRFAERLPGSRPAEDLPPLGGRFAADWRNGRVTAEASTGGIAGTAARARLEMPLLLEPPFSIEVPAGQPVSGEVVVDSDLAKLSPVLPLGEDLYGGTLAARASIGGTTGGGERISGHATLAEGFYESFEFGTVLRDVQLRLSGRDDQVEVQIVRATDGGGGSLSGGGVIRVDPRAGFPLDIGFGFGDFMAVRRDEAEARVDGQLSLTGNLGAPLLSGRMRLSQADISIPNRLPTSVTRVDVIQVDRAGDAPAPGGQAPAAASMPLAEALRLDLLIEAPARIFVRGRGLDSEWSGRLNIGGTAAEPRILGTVEKVRGDFDLAGKIFELDKGVIRFTGDADPSLDIVAAYSGEDIVARVLIGGQASNPTFALDSTPALPQEEILSRVLFGQGVGSLTALQAAQLAETALTLSGGLGGGGVLDRFRRNLGLDRLDVRSEGEGLSGNTLSAGKYISERVYVGVDQGMGSGGSRVRVEIKVLPNVTVESRVGANAENEIGVNWRWDY